jgi:hypothetical protein
LRIAKTSSAVNRFEPGFGDGIFGLLESGSRHSKKAWDQKLQEPRKTGDFAMSGRDTPYAKELKTGKRELSDHSEARVERLFVKGYGQEEIRFSWWKDGKMMTRPLDLPEEDFVALIREGVAQGVFSPETLAELKTLFAQT